MSSIDVDKKSTAPDIDKKIESAKSGRKPGDLKPCERCRSQHLKCVYDSDKCRRCERSGVECVRNTKKIRFRGVQISKLRGDRKKPTSNGSKNNHTATDTVDQDVQPVEDHDQEIDVGMTGTNQDASNELYATGVQSTGELSWQVPTTISAAGSTVAEHPEPSPTASFHNGSALSHYSTTSSGFVQPPRPAPRSIPPHFENGHNTLTDDTYQPLTRVASSDGMSAAPSFSPSQRSATRTATTGLLDQLVKYPVKGTKTTSLDYLENVLLRYFHDELAPWFDLCDPDCHFAFVVPHKTREPGPLRNAILTISARNLSRNMRFRNEAGVIEWAGHQLPDLREEFAMTYHNDCIRDLLQMSMDPKKLQDEILLAAVIALRTDEELSLSALDGEEEDQQLFLRIASVFINAQVPAAICLPHSSPEVFPAVFDELPRPRSHSDIAYQISPRSHSNITSPSGQTDPDLGASGLRQACFWTAFRQELHASFLRQQEVRFPLARCEAFRQLSPAIDAVWANRMVTFCADVLEFCYGSSCSDGKVFPAYTNQERWVELRNHERNLCAMLPASFEPTFCSESNVTKGIIFPEIWYLESCHVSGTTYIELARMLLEAFNPTRPKLGHGFLAATNAFIASTKKILFRLCGIALSNHQFCPPSLINACLGISMFGEYFEDPVEQEALLGILSLMSSRHAYPTHQIANSLRRAWNQDDTHSDMAT